MTQRRGVFADPTIKELGNSFIPVADEVGLLQSHEGPEGVLFRKIAEKGHYGGRTFPSATRQGIYAAAPNGEFLGSINSSDASEVAAMLRAALERWKTLTKEQRLLTALPDEKGRFRHEWRYPADGMVLRAFTRDLPRDPPVDSPRAKSWNQDYAWFKKEELGGFVPEAKVGAKREVPRAVIARLARLNLVDNVRGQTWAYEPKDVQKAELTATVSAVNGGTITMKLEGATRCVAKGRWSVGGYRDDDRPSDQERGVETRLLGSAVFDSARGKFARFDLVALGSRWGATQYNGRSRDRGPAPFGAAFELAGDSPAERVAPAHAYAE